MSEEIRSNWEQLSLLLRGRRLPLALVDLDALDANVRRVADPVRRAGKTLRVASKSIRCPAVLRRIVDSDAAVFRGIMAYTCEEAEFLAGKGFDDFLIAYPSVQPSDMGVLARLAKAGKHAAIVVDCREHLEALNAEGERAGVTLRACIDVDTSYRPAGGLLHLGVRRSPIRSARDTAALARAAASMPGVAICGVMAYEAHIAGVADRNPFTPRTNAVKRAMKRAARPATARLRRQVREAVEAEGVTLDFFNGGGTGSVDWTAGDASVTEVTAGSGFLCPHLFSYYDGLPLVPAALFALQAVRVSDPGFVTCHGGGYVASGEAGPDRLPVPYLPEGLSLVGMEGAGEVQTPLVVAKGAPTIRIGDPVFFRHAKAGELAERFNEYLLVRNGQVVEEVPTYRGLGRSFL